MPSFSYQSANALFAAEPWKANRFRQKKISRVARLIIVEELNQKLEAMVPPEGEGGFGLFGLALPAKEGETLPKVASALNGLMTIVESADAAPTDDAETASAKWDKAAEETLAHWADFQNKELANTNTLLGKANLKSVTTTETSGVH